MPDSSDPASNGADAYDLQSSGSPTPVPPVAPSPAGGVVPPSSPAGQSPVPGAAPATNPSPSAPVDSDDLSIELEPEPLPASEPSSSSPRPAAGRAAGAAAPAAEPEPLRPFNRATSVEWPLAVAGCAAAIFIAACLAGQSGLFPSEGETPVSPDLFVRAVLALRGLLMMLLCGGSLVAGAAAVQMIDRRPIGDLRALAARMLLISSIGLLSRVMPIDIHFLKMVYNILAPVAIAWLGVVLLFRAPPRDAGMVIGAAILALILLAFGSTIVQFAVWV